jgi:response regulator RpfG family c-di-GMP phosphodiesterase
VRQTSLPLGECFAGRAAAERRTVAVPDLAGTPNGFSRNSLLADEGFRIYLAAPLIAKGHVHGVLEIFNRKPFEPDGEWRDYLDTLAGQLAIAIENRTLFESLQRSNAELALAYDRTLEGWSRALELRDRETHGHTARVVERTIRLARAMGVEAEALEHVRRGVLLHDIGKMAIPDSILLKPGPLTEDEWVVMRQHPQFAFELLSPMVSFSRPSPSRTVTTNAGTGPATRAASPAKRSRWRRVSSP